MNEKVRIINSIDEALKLALKYVRDAYNDIRILQIQCNKEEKGIEFTVEHVHRYITVALGFLEELRKEVKE